MPSSSATYRIDPVTLRDIPDDEAAARAYVAELCAYGEDGDAERVPWLRMLGHLEEAEAVGRAALERAGGAGERGGVAPALRLAHVLHWQGRFRDADALFDTARTTAEQVLHEAERQQEQERQQAQAAAGDTRDRTRRWAAAMLSFADQHQGKARFDEGRHAEALALFERALSRRVAEQAPEDQLASTRQAITATRARLHEDGQARRSTPR